MADIDVKLLLADQEALVDNGGNPDGALMVREATVKSSASTPILLSEVSGDTVERFEIQADGTIWWGSGSGARDTRLRRTGVGALEVSGALAVGGNLVGSSLISGEFYTSVANAGAYLWLPGTHAQIEQRLGAHAALVVKGAPGQAAHLTAWVNNGGATLAYFDNAGGLATPYVQSPAATGSYLALEANYAVVRQRVAASVGLIVQGAAAQTADVQQWHNSAGSVLGAVDAFGGINISYVQNIAETGAYVYLGGGSVVEVIQRDPAAPPLVIRQAAAQSTYNTIWQDSSSNLIAAVEQTGGIRTPYVQSKDAAGTYLSFPGTNARFEQRDPAQVVLAVKGASGQAVPFLSFLDSTDTVRGFVDSAGGIYAPYFTDSAYTGSYINLIGGGPMIVTQRNPAAIVAAIKGAPAQATNMLQIQNSADVILAAIDKDGVLSTNQAAIGGNTGILAPIPLVHLAVVAGSSTLVPIVARGAASHTADLQQWQDSAGGSMAKIGYGTIGGNMAMEFNIGGGARFVNIGGFLGLNAESSSPMYLGETADTGSVIVRRALTMGDTKNIVFSYGTGTKIGEDAAQKFAFWGANPIVRPTGVPVTAAGIHAALVNIGLIAA